MPTPTKRPQRARQDSRREDAVPDTSSPSRPAKRRKQAAPDSPRDTHEDEDSSLVADSSTANMNGETDIVTRIAQRLVTPHGQLVQASKDHSNSIHESNTTGVNAYAKIAAQDWTFYVTQLSVNIGRTSEPAPQYPAGRTAQDEEDHVHIDLGPSKTISRSHALISYDSQGGAWFLQVKGRNGVKVNGIPCKLGVVRPLVSGEVLEIGGIEMMFVLPLDTSPIDIHEAYLERAGISPAELDSPSQQSRKLRPSSASDQLGGTRNALPRGQPFPQPIAPAPPDYKRPGTPPSARRALASHKSPGFKEGSTMVMNPNDIDLSSEDNKHIKPQYSYAQMISQAILNTTDGKLNLSGIYTFITDNYSYYRHQAAAGWQNSIRHNLSLNKAFEKTARSTEEPGKGMKWYILPEMRDDMARNAYRGGRGGHRGSSNPSSPSQLSYVNQGMKEMAARDQGSARKRKVSPSGSPQPRSIARMSHMTPDRTSRRLLPEEAPSVADGSPLPRFKKSNVASSVTKTEPAPRSPTLTSSYLPDEGSSFVTPAPHRVEVKLNPPSTLQRPSQHMPTSSPAPFWRYADIGGSTPMKQLDLSPVRAPERLPASSSPPPAPGKSPVESPARQVRASRTESPDLDSAPVKSVLPDEDVGFDLTKGFQSISSYHSTHRGNAPTADGDVNDQYQHQHRSIKVETLPQASRR